MTEAVKVGDLFAIQVGGRFETFKVWRFYAVTKVTPGGKLRFEDVNGLWTLTHSSNGTEAVRSGDKWTGRTWALRVTEETRGRFIADNVLSKLRLLRDAARILRCRKFDPVLMTEERVKLLEQFLNETEVHS